MSGAACVKRRAEGLAEGEAFYLVTGRYQAKSAEELGAFLEAVGASLVFLIDWNKARKALRKLVSNSDAIRVLDWAARHEFGHRGFLELGGTELIASAVRRAAPARIGFGEELGNVLGREATLKFLETALRLATVALREGRSARSVRESSRSISCAGSSATTARSSPSSSASSVLPATSPHRSPAM